MLAGLVIGLPPVLNYGSEEVYNRVVPEVGSYSMSQTSHSPYISWTRHSLGRNMLPSRSLKPLLVVTSVVCKRQRSVMAIIGSSQGPRSTQCHPQMVDHALTRECRWITNGTFADYFTTGCRTDVCLLLSHLYPAMLINNLITRLVSP